MTPRPFQLLLPFLITGCLIGSPQNLQAETIEVEVYKFKFIPENITIHKGDTVVWINKEKRQYHSVWFEELEEEEPDYFFPGESYSRTFKTTGTFPYRCGPHPKMLGSVTVK